MEQSCLLPRPRLHASCKELSHPGFATAQVSFRLIMLCCHTTLTPWTDAFVCTHLAMVPWQWGLLFKTQHCQRQWDAHPEALLAYSGQRTAYCCRAVPS